MENNTNLPDITNDKMPTADEIISEVAQISSVDVEVPSVEDTETPTAEVVSQEDASSETQADAEQVQVNVPGAEPTDATQPQTIPADPVKVVEIAQPEPQSAEPTDATQPQTIPADPVKVVEIAQPEPQPAESADVSQPQTIPAQPVQSQPAQPVQTAVPTYIPAAAPQTNAMNYQYAGSGAIQDESDKILKKNARNLGLGAIAILVLFWILVFVLDRFSIWFLIIPFILSFDSLKKSRAKSVAGWIGMIGSVLTALLFVLSVALMVAS